MQNAPKKICLVGISLAYGGAERSMAILSNMLFNKGYEVHSAVLNDAISYSFSGNLLNLGINKPKNDNLINRFSRLKKLRNYLKTNNIDCVIDHRPKNQFFRELFYKHYVYQNIEKIYVVHSARQNNFFRESKRKLSKIFEGNFATVAVSKHIENNILKSAGIENTTTIYNAFNPNWQTNQSEIPEFLSSKEYILFYGRLDDKVKDIRFLLNAFSKSELWKKNIFLVILGNGNDDISLKYEASELECAANILFYPFVENPFPLVKNAKFVTLTSRYEGFPMVLVESLSQGTPVVTLDIVSGPSEIIKDRVNGLLVKNRNTSDFIKAMNEMFNNNELYEHCKLNAESSVKDFSMEHIAEQWHDLLKRL